MLAVLCSDGACGILCYRACAEVKRFGCVVTLLGWIVRWAPVRGEDRRSSSGGRVSMQVTLRNAGRVARRRCACRSAGSAVCVHHPAEWHLAFARRPTSLSKKRQESGAEWSRFGSLLKKGAGTSPRMLLGGVSGHQPGASPLFQRPARGSGGHRAALVAVPPVVGR